jgi:hypothetical protein
MPVLGILMIMTRTKISTFILFVLISLLHHATAHAQTVELTIKKEQPCKQLKFVKTNSVKGVLTVKFGLEPGIVGFALLDDENSNGKMDYNFIRYPLEGFGFSNYYHKGFTKPNLDEFSFKLTEHTIQKVLIEIRYL